MTASKMIFRLGIVACLVALPTAVAAQSTIAGIVKDSSGAILPGVTVEASSDVLIEKMKTVTTDGSGQYRIIDLRPGIYAVTFTLPGFQTIKREQVDLPGDFTATIDASMKIGGIEETITVSSASPVVDVQSAAHVQVVNREAIDSLPSGKSVQSIGQLIVGVKLNAPDVGGSRVAGTQTYMSIRGQSAAENNVMIDGMLANSLEANGQVLGQYSHSMSQEFTYQTSGGTAERSGGGVGVNMIPREGGNRFNGWADYSHRPGQWQGDNQTQRLKDLGLQATDGIAYIFDGSLSEGGPIKKDKVWFFASLSDSASDNLVANTFFDNGDQGDDLNYLIHALGRTTWQISPRNKFTAFYDWIDKYRGHDMQSLVDPETASLIWTWKNFSTGQFKYTSMVSSKFFIEAGATFNWALRNQDGQPGTEFDRLTPQWFAGASRTTQVAGPRSTSAATASSDYKRSWVYLLSGSYVTGAHRIKIGFNNQFGSFFHDNRSNADLTQRYSSYTTNPETHNFNFVGPVDVLIRNTPLTSTERLDANLGIFAQDTWTIDRLTLNYGLRWEYLSSSVDASVAPAGRFVPERTTGRIKDVPKWKDWAPRFSLIYDLFGNSKTAVKYSVNRYNLAQTTSIASSFNALGSQLTQAVSWTDLNGNDVAEGARTWDAAGAVYTDCVYLSPGCELNLTQLRSNFGLLSDVGTYAGFPRSWNLEHGFEVQHELMPRLSVGMSYYHRSLHDLTKTVNTALQSSDFTPITIFNPIDGTPITYYNISAAANARASNNVTVVEPTRKSKYDAYSVDFRLRLPAGGQVFGGASSERLINVSCDTSVAGAIVDPNTLRFCDDNENGIPFVKDFRLSVTYPLPAGVTVSASYQDNAGAALTQTYTFSRTIRYPDGSASFKNAGGQIVPACPAQAGCVPGGLTAPTLTVASGSVALQPAGVLREERLHQLDLKVSRGFKAGAIRLAPFFEAFNVTNQDKVLTRASTAYANAAGTYFQPNSILNGRILGVGANLSW